MLQFQQVTKGYGGEILLDDLSFKINKGEKCGLVGRNGSGKTTLLRLMTQEEEPDLGSIELPKSYTLGYLSQYLHFSEKTLLEEAALSLRAEEKDRLYKAEKILFGLGFKEADLEKDPQVFSGGYQLRLHLAKVLIQEPDCLLLDEPTNYLDIVSIRWFTRFLRRWRGELVVISHDRDFMDSVVTHIIGIHRNKIHKQKGHTEKFYSYVLQKEEVHEKTRLNLEKKREHMSSFITKLGAKATKAAQAGSRKKALERMPVLEELAKFHHLDFKFPYSPFRSAKLIDVKDVDFTYENMSSTLIESFNLSIEKRDRIAIVGKNGRGKSTLLRLLAQDLIPNRGSVQVSVNAKIGFFGQTNIDRLHPKMTIEDEIASASFHLSISEVRKICGIMMFSGDRAKKNIEVLSGGERSRVLLGKILASPCNLLLLDEPTNHLDMESIEALVMALEEFEGALVIVTHSEMILRLLPSKFVICHEGNQHLFFGDYDEFLEKEGWEPKEKVLVKTKDKASLKEQKKQEIKHLQFIQKQVKRVEASIMDLEAKRDQEAQKLILVSQKGDRELITQLSRSIKEKTEQTECLYEELEQLLSKLDGKAS